MEKEELTSRLSSLSVHNVNKRIKRRDIKIAQSQSQVKQLECSNKPQDELEANLKAAHSSADSVRQKLNSSDERSEATSNANKKLNAELELLKCQFSTKFDELQQQIEALQRFSFPENIPPQLKCKTVTFESLKIQIMY